MLAVQEADLLEVVVGLQKAEVDLLEAVVDLWEAEVDLLEAEVDLWEAKVDLWAVLDFVLVLVEHFPYDPVKNNIRIFSI